MVLDASTSPSEQFYLLPCAMHEVTWFLLACLPHSASLTCLPQSASLTCLPQSANLTCLPQYASLTCLPQYASLTCLSSVIVWLACLIMDVWFACMIVWLAWVWLADLYVFQVGHVLGLVHSDRAADLMGPFYDSSRVALTGDYSSVLFLWILVVTQFLN